MEFFKFIFSDFGHFIGFMIIIMIVLTFIYAMWNRFLRHLSLMKHGYPQGTDADGEFQKKEEEKE